MSQTVSGLNKQQDLEMFSLTTKENTFIGVTTCSSLSPTLQAYFYVITKLNGYKKLPQILQTSLL